ncbi:MAG: hypothetical protein L0211_19455 [Planctomycetaceae bacterium]|nr:hypothetical protein [Planctomycetaceae bacterium]
MIILLFIVAVCASFGIMLLQLWIHARWYCRPLRRVALRVGGHLETSWFVLPEIKLRLDNFEAVVEFVGTGKAGSETLFRVPWTDPQLRCELRQLGVVGRIWSLLQARPVELAAPLLDDSYVVTGNDEPQIRRLFSARVQTALLQLAPLAPNPLRHPDIRLTIEDGLLTVAKPSHILDETMLEGFIRLCAELHDAALDAMGSTMNHSASAPSKSCA